MIRLQAFIVLFASGLVIAVSLSSLLPGGIARGALAAPALIAALPVLGLSLLFVSPLGKGMRNHQRARIRELIKYAEEDE